MAGRDAAGADLGADKIAVAALGCEIDLRRRSRLDALDLAQIKRGAEVTTRVADQDQRISIAFECQVDGTAQIGDQPDATTTGVGLIALPLVSLYNETLPETTG